MSNWIAMLIQQLMNSITPELRKAVIEFVTQLEKQAAATPNRWDDIFVAILKSVLVIP